MCQVCTGSPPDGLEPAMFYPYLACRKGHTVQIKRIQEYLKNHELDGWLLADFHGRNGIAMELLGMTSTLTRRSFCFIPARGEPVALVHPIEAVKFSSFPGRVVPYRGYRGLEAALAELMTDVHRVAMEYAPLGRFPAVGLVDAGTIELVRSMGVQVVSSADMVADLQARLSPDQIVSHRAAAEKVIAIKEEAFAFITESLRARTPVCEYDVCRLILRRFEQENMITDFGPNCSVGAHAGDPHYEPSAQQSAPIEPGRIVLIDLWARFDTADGVYADITWMGYTGVKEEIPARYSEMFGLIVRARDAAVSFLRDNLSSRPVSACEVDDVCREVIEQGGYGKQFTHRTGHSITSSVHGPGPNIDNLESEDNRRLQPGHLFSIEPGIYFDDCGFRTEIDCLVTPDGVEVTTLPLQTEIKVLL